MKIQELTRIRSKSLFMFFSTENILLIGSVLLFVSLVAGKTGYRFGVPDIIRRFSNSFA